MLEQSSGSLLGLRVSHEVVSGCQPGPLSWKAYLQPSSGGSASNVVVGKKTLFLLAIDRNRSPSMGFSTGLLGSLHDSWLAPEFVSQQRT